MPYVHLILNDSRVSEERHHCLYDDSMAEKTLQFLLAHKTPWRFGHSIFGKALTHRNYKKGKV